MKALYRRYRPKTLSEVVGQKQITDVLARAIKEQKLAHAYLFVGPRGTGKTSVARILAHEANGFPYELEDDYVDIIEIDAASNTGVDNIRDLREKAFIAPTVGKYKVYIIDEVHMLSKSAFNALLKTLEEPPEHVIFIMATTEKHKVPITILSRSQVFQFKLADPGTMLAHLQKICKKEHIAIETDALRIIVKRGGGSYRDSLSLLEQISGLSDKTITAQLITDALGLPRDEAVSQLIFAYKNQDIATIRQLLAGLVEQGIKADLIASELIEAVISDPTPELLPLLEKLTAIDAQSSYAEVKLLLALCEPSAQIAPTRPKLNPSQTPPPIPQQAPQNAPDSADTPPAEPKPEPPQKLTRPDPNTSAEDIWRNVLATAENQAKNVYNFLTSGEHEIVDQTLKIYAQSSFKKQQIEKKRAILAGALPENYELTISVKKITKDDELAAIADIMGGGEEVQINE